MSARVTATQMRVALGFACSYCGAPGGEFCRTKAKLLGSETGRLPDETLLVISIHAERVPVALAAIPD